MALSVKSFSLVIYLSLGIVGGIMFPSGAPWLAPVGTLYISALKLVSIPLIFLSCLLAVSTIGSKDLLKSIGPKVFGYYFGTSALAALTGASCCIWFLDGPSAAPSVDHGQTGAASFASLVTRFIPSNLFSPFVDGNVLQLLFIALFAGVALLQTSQDTQSKIRDILGALNEWTMVAVRWVINLTPYASFFLAYELIATLNFQTLTPFKQFLFACVSAGVIHALLTLPLILKFLGKVSPFKFIRAVKDALMVALTTASSAGTLPVSMTVLKQAGVRDQTSSIVLPLGATINMDGSAIYQAQLLIFMSVMSGVPLSFALIAQIFILVLLSSAGTAGVPGGGVAMMSLMIATLGLPIEYLSLYILIDRVLDYPITAVNVWGDLVGAKVIDTHLQYQED